MADAIAARLREAREWIGFTRADVAAALQCSPLLIASLEEGGAEPAAEMLERLGKLYRRPVWWLRGESRFQPSEETLSKLEDLPSPDREVILDFMEWLQDAGPPPKPRRAAGDPPQCL